MCGVCVVIVTYYPEAPLPERVRDLASQAAYVVIVDNHSAGSAQVEALRDLDHPRICVIENPVNGGIAIALNIGLEWAKTAGFKWVLTLDQDSLPCIGIGEQLTRIREACEAEGANVAVVGANYRNAGTSKINLPADMFGDRLWQYTDIVITSGSLVSVASWEAVGGFRDEFFIDSVDQDFCLRLGLRGYKIAVSRNSLMTHSLGNYRLVRLFGLEVPVTDYPPFRRYYSIRNKLVLVREYLFKRPGWAFKQLRTIMQDVILILGFESEKIDKLAAMRLGVWHFLSNRLGKSPKLHSKLEAQ